MAPRYNYQIEGNRGKM